MNKQEKTPQPEGWREQHEFNKPSRQVGTREIEGVDCAQAYKSVDTNKQLDQGLTAYNPIYLFD